MYQIQFIHSSSNHIIYSSTVSKLISHYLRLPSGLYSFYYCEHTHTNACLCLYYEYICDLCIYQKIIGNARLGLIENYDFLLFRQKNSIFRYSQSLGCLILLNYIFPKRERLNKEINGNLK